ncbi:MAG: aminoglycoside phosphotransferase family protein [Rickettsiales bacterium]|jgi:Ser/Thr protein kinase RdoA (MazF antagonist)|nr:aminoglycoside phosphotransferase family protein [Rickettsiales bacterium]
MIFKLNWEKSQKQHQLPEGVIERMIEVAFPDKEIISSKLIAGGCANLNLIVQLKNESDPIILRVYLRDKDSVYREKRIGELLKDTVPVPEINYIGDIENYRFAIVKFMPGIALRDLLLSDKDYNLEKIMYEVGSYTTKIASHKFTKSGFFNNKLEIVKELPEGGLKEFSVSCLEHQNIKKYLGKDMISKIRLLLNSIPIIKDTNINLVHADYDPANILVDKIDGKWKVSAILDWEFAYSGSWVNDVANILRYSHKMPDSFKLSFLRGIEDNGFKLPKDWQIIVHQYNLASMLDSMIRHDLESCPNIRQDLCELINHVVVELSGAEWEKL